MCCCGDVDVISHFYWPSVMLFKIETVSMWWRTILYCSVVLVCKMLHPSTGFAVLCYTSFICGIGEKLRVK